MSDISLNNGMYDNDGNPINPHSIPKPGLCVLCNLDDDSDTEENLLCNLNRFDQRNEKDFMCGAFEPKEKGL
jgi:hypothetical protein